MPAERDGAGRHEDHLPAGLRERGDVVGQRGEPGGLQLPVARSTSRLEPILTTMRRALAHSGRAVKVVASGRRAAHLELWFDYNSGYVLL